MKKLRYRGWDKKDKIMWEPLTLEELIIGGWELESNDQEYSLPHKDYLSFAHGDTIWMRGTGLKDKNKKEIFEGDIVKVDWNDSRYEPVICEVTWDEKSGEWNFGAGSTSEVCWSHEVIGNKYQHRKLLKKAK